MADAYTAYRKLAKSSGISITLLSCWAHSRRRFLESQDPKNPDPVVREVINRIIPNLKTNQRAVAPKEKEGSKAEHNALAVFKNIPGT